MGASTIESSLVGDTTAPEALDNEKLDQKIYQAFEKGEYTITGNTSLQEFVLVLETIKESRNTSNIFYFEEFQKKNIAYVINLIQFFIQDTPQADLKYLKENLKYARKFTRVNTFGRVVSLQIGKGTIELAKLIIQRIEQK